MPGCAISSRTCSAHSLATPRPEVRRRPTKFPIVRGSAIDGHEWSAGDARNPFQIKKLEMVARDGQIRRERIWTCAARPQGEGHGRPESINHRHADFQSNGELGSARISRRPRMDFRVTDRTRRGPIRFNGLCASRANSFRTGSRTGPRWVATHSPSPPRDPLPQIHHASTRTLYGEKRP